MGRILLERVARHTATVAAVAGIAATAILGSSSSASAAIGFAPPSATVPKGYVKLCARGSYAAFLQPTSGNYASTTLVPAGNCWYGRFGSSSRTTTFNVMGKYNTSSNTFLIKTLVYDGSLWGIGITTRGTTANQGADAYIDLW